MTRRYDPRRALPHLSYSRAQLAATFNVGLGTISSWISKGLRTIDGKRPYLFAGSAVREFLKQHNKPRQPLEPGEIFCVACKKVIGPKDGIVNYAPLSDTLGNLIGTCPTCGRSVWRRVRQAEIAVKAGSLKVQYKDASATFIENGKPLRVERSSELQS